MKKVFTIILASALAFTFSSCQKSEIEKPVEGVPMTLTASIDVPQADTKTALVYDDVNKVLKTSWVAGDKVSVFTLDANGVPLSHDIFTATAVSGHTADFTGTFTGSIGYSRIIVQYPALETDESNKYVFNGTYAVYDVMKATQFSHYAFNRGLESDIELNGDLSGFDEYDAMKGEGTIIGDGKLEVSLKKMISVIRLEIDGSVIPNDATINEIVLKASSLQFYTVMDWAYTRDISFCGGSPRNQIVRNFHKLITLDKRFVVYMPNSGLESDLDGSNIWIEVITKSNGTFKSNEKMMGPTHILKPGYIYNFKAKVNAVLIE